jgi:hypothetical protein
VPLKENGLTGTFIKPRKKSAPKEKPEEMSQEVVRDCIRQQYFME